MLDYARRRPPKRTHIDGSDVVGQTRALLRSLADQNGVELEVGKSATPSDLFADPDQLQQVLINIVMNAVHASSEGGSVRIGIEHSVRAIAGKTREFVVFTVSDLGHGIDEQVKERIFEPFFTTKPFCAQPGDVFMIYLPRRADDAGPSSSR